MRVRVRGLAPSPPFFFHPSIHLARALRARQLQCFLLLWMMTPDRVSHDGLHEPHRGRC